MGNITLEELAERRASGASVEMSPQKIVIEGLLDQLRGLAPDNTEVLEAIRILVEKIDSTAVVAAINKIPETEVMNNNYNDNSVVVDTTPILEAVERLTHKHDYHFTVNRDKRGRIESMDAVIV